MWKSLCLISVCLLYVSMAQKIRLPTTNTGELRKILATREGAAEFVKCVMFPKQCQDNRAVEIARLAPLLMRSRGRCKNIKGISCTPNDEKKIAFVIKTLSSRYNDLYNDLTRYLIRNS